MEYNEIHEVRTNSFGLFTLVIGQGEPSSSSFNFINWTTGKKWLQVELDENGGRNFKLMGSQQLMSVPYALYAERAGNGYQAGNGIAINNNMITNLGDGDHDSSNELISEVTLGSDNKLRITDAGGVKEADLSSLVGGSQNLNSVLSQGNSAGNNPITNLGAPTASSDAATKLYVDNLDTADEDKSATNEIQNLSQVLTQNNNAGGTKITNLGTPTVNTDAATKLYVDNLHTADGDKSATNEIQNLSQVLTQSNNAGGTKITNLGAPTVNTDATTKKYVDDADNALSARIANNYAFKVVYNHTHTTPTTQVVTFVAEEFDDFSLVNGNTFTAPENGTYQFTVSGTSPIGGIPMQIRAVVSGVPQLTDVKRQLSYPNSSIINYFDSTVIKLSAGDTVELIVTSGISNEIVVGSFFGFKL
jgi:hypothetical protein